LRQIYICQSAQARIQAAEATEALAALQASDTANKRRLAACEADLRAATEQLRLGAEAAARQAQAVLDTESELGRVRGELSACRAQLAKHAERADAAEASAEQLRELPPQLAALRARTARAEASAACEERRRTLLEERAAALAAELRASRHQADAARVEARRTQGQLLGIRAEVSAWAAGGCGDGGSSGQSDGSGSDGEDGSSGGTDDSHREQQRQHEGKARPGNATRDLEITQERVQLLQVGWGRARVPETS
jgi:hypothetical protein